MKTLLAFGLLVSLAVASRVAPHDSTPNLAAVAAVAMFAGWYFRSRVLAVAAPLSAMLIADAVLGGYEPLVMMSVYGSFIAPVFFGRWIGRRREASAAAVLGHAALGALAASTLFFITTNFAVWAGSDLYTRTMEGLAACYAAALPFFRFTVAGDLGFAVVLFGGCMAARALLKTRRVPAGTAA